MTPTLHSRLSSAELCRANGWMRGTVLEGNEGYGAERIQITAVGDQSILAVKVEAKPGHLSAEGSWCLSCRDWREVRP